MSRSICFSVISIFAGGPARRLVRLGHLRGHFSHVRVYVFSLTTWWFIIAISTLEAHYLSDKHLVIWSPALVPWLLCLSSSDKVVIDSLQGFNYLIIVMNIKSSPIGQPFIITSSSPLLFSAVLFFPSWDIFVSTPDISRRTQIVARVLKPQKFENPIFSLVSSWPTESYCCKV